jgi:hypothetical protein
MRRLLTNLTTAVLLLMSLGIGLFTADLPFWRRAIDLPLAAGETYLPTVVIDSHVRMGRLDVDPARVILNAAALEAASERARAAGAYAMLVTHGVSPQFERYYPGTADSRSTPRRPADFLARPLAALAVEAALAEGRIDSLDSPVSRWLHEWAGESRGKITLRQLLNETSGLETGADAAALFGSRPFEDLSHLPDFATSRGARLLLGNDFESTALGFQLEHEPGGFFNLSPVNTQLVAIILERATGVAYEQFLGGRVFADGVKGQIELQMDRRSGMPAAHCCLLTNPRTVANVVDRLMAEMFLGLVSDAKGPGRSWFEEMRRGSRANPEFGLQIERLANVTPVVWQLGHQKGGAAWLIPEASVSVVVLAPRDVVTPVAIIEPLLQSLRK